MPSLAPATRHAGFTLLELMFVVVILGVLSTVALVSYQGYVRQARMQEAASMLTTIGVRQEAYFQTYSQYVDSGANDTDFYPNAIWGTNCTQTNANVWDLDCSDSDPNHQGFCALGVDLVGAGVDGGGETYFQYLTFGWAPGDTVTACSGTQMCFIPDTTRPWWVAVAQGDQRCDPQTTRLSLSVLSSQSRDVIVLDVNEGDNTDDWSDGSFSRQSVTGAF